QYRTELRSIEDRITIIEEAQHSLDYLTVEGICKFIQQQYIVARSLYNLDGTLVFDNFNDINFSLLQLIYSDLQNYMITISQLREIARTDPWIPCWRVSKVDAFGK